MLGRTAAIVDLWPTASSHPSRRVGRRMLTVAGAASWDAVLASVKSAKAAKPVSAVQPFDLLSLVRPPTQKAA